MLDILCHPWIKSYGFALDQLYKWNYCIQPHPNHQHIAAAHCTTSDENNISHHNWINFLGSLCILVPFIQAISTVLHTITHSIQWETCSSERYTCLMCMSLELLIGEDFSPVITWLLVILVQAICIGTAHILSLDIISKIPHKFILITGGVAKKWAVVCSISTVVHSITKPSSIYTVLVYASALVFSALVGVIDFNSSTDYSPYYLLVGGTPKLSIDLIIPSPETDHEQTTHLSFVDKWKKQMAQAYEIANRQSMQRKSKDA